MSVASKVMGAALPAMSQPALAVSAMVDALVPVSSEEVALREATGRVLARPVCADRDSPAVDVSAMDGYAVGRATLSAGDELPVAGEVLTGGAAGRCAGGSAVRVFTGGAVPDGAVAVIRREALDELGDRVRLRAGATVSVGDHIRRRGENARAGSEVLEAGARLTPAAVACASAFGVTSVSVHRRVRVAAVVTGRELALDDANNDGSAIAETMIRDANGPALASLIEPVAWCRWLGVTHVGESFDATRRAIVEALEQADVVILTGGVSMGDHDHVASAVADVCAQRAGRVVYHTLSMRPGKPNLGAVVGSGQAILALPGNPVSTLIGAVVLVAPVLRKLGGLRAQSPRPACNVLDPRQQTLGLTWYRLARLDEHGRAVAVTTMGSGDLVSAGLADGFFEQPPNEPADAKPRPWHTWQLNP